LSLAISCQWFLEGNSARGRYASESAASRQ